MEKLRIMLKKSALEFSGALSDLWLMENICDSSTSLELSEQDILDTKLKVQDVLEKLRRICTLSNLSAAVEPELQRFQGALQSPIQMEPFAKLAQRCDHLRNRILDELENEYFFQVDRSEVQLYKKRGLFGTRVTKKFNAALDDIVNAGNCLAVQQPTACVFHLMRAMEVAVRKLSKRLNITITPQTTWRQMTNEMDTKIRAMPANTDAQRRKKNNWEAARINLHHVGSVWRNNTMHPAASYTRSEARHVFNATRVL